MEPVWRSVRQAHVLNKMMSSRELEGRFIIRKDVYIVDSASLTVLQKKVLNILQSTI